jgi:hypothetical protein
LVADVYGYFHAALPLFAVVEAAGVRARSSGATGAMRIGTGEYEVDFVRDVTSCACQATIGRPDTAIEVPGFITCQLRGGNANGLLLTTADSTATPADRDFSVQVACPLLPVAGP